MAGSMFGLSDTLVRKALQVGVVPMTILGGSACLVFYSTTTFVAANQWAAVGSVVAGQHATNLRQHAATVAATAAVSGAIGMEAVRDWLEYAAPPQGGDGKVALKVDQLAAKVYTQKHMFFLRPMVVVTAVVGFGTTLFGTGAIRFGQPANRPAMVAAK